MKIVILNTSERAGGAAVAANRLMKALNKAGLEANMLVRDRQTDDARVASINTSYLAKKISFIRFAWERFVIFAHNRFSKKNLFAVSLANTGSNVCRHPLVKAADIIHLHWINQGFLSLKNIRQLVKLGKPIVWTMHDLWVGAGICHYPGECEKYKSECSDCPFLRGKTSHDLSYKVFSLKKKLNLNRITYVGCSRWIANEAKKSALLQNAFITNIPNPIDTTIFKPCDKTDIRQKKGLPVNRKLVLFAAAKLSDVRKGMSYLVEACRYLQQKNIDVVFLGGKMDDNLLCAIPLPTHRLGYLRTSMDIASVYAACDVFVTPSLEDNLPNTIMEAMACGTPCVGFNIGGIPEMIDHKVNGYIATYKSAEDLAKGIRWALFEADYSALSKNAAKKAQRHYNEEAIANQYINLYKKLYDKA
ncbi:MAG: glycosyltransferase family 4 protein [Prevotellaceae bacterium]|jgi:glycosyltransferase involved in cell wall biosynthesis|nr:glycosyltransferase family 4 protein [Prevotellaceae bacterium]